MILLRNKYQQ